MAVTETTTESWGSRLGSSIRGVLIGGALFISGFPVLFYNEGNSVKTAKAIDEGEGACIAVESNANIDQENNDKLVKGFDAYKGSTTMEKVTGYVKSLGFTDADIEKLRSLMLE